MVIIPINQLRYREKTLIRQVNNLSIFILFSKFRSLLFCVNEKTLVTETKLLQRNWCIKLLHKIWSRLTLIAGHVNRNRQIFSYKCSLLTFLWFHNILTLGLPLREYDWSITSSCTKLAEWIISAIMATCLCLYRVVLWKWHLTEKIG